VKVRWEQQRKTAQLGEDVAEKEWEFAMLPAPHHEGRNPGLEATAALLAREPVRRKERARHEALEEKFPTCALAILDFDVGRWRDVVQGTGKLVDFVRPKDL